MLPAVWAGWKGANVAWKIGSIALPIVLLIGLYWLGHWRGYDEGEQRADERHAQQALDQAAKVVEQTAKQAELPPTVLQEFIRDREEAQAIRATLEQTIRDYERERKARRAHRPSAAQKETNHEISQPVVCDNPDPLDDSFERHWDTIARMFLEEDGDRAESSTDRNPESVSGLPAAPLQTDTLLRARTVEFDEYKRLLDTYNGLREFAKGVYILQKTWHDRQEADRESPR